MSSPGQIIGGVVGAVIGFFTPAGPIIGAQIGMMAGGLIDPPKGPHQYGPRLSDTSVQVASYGTPIPRVYGTVGLYGTVIWIENNRLLETEKTEKQGGKGGGGSKVTTYTYSVTCAILLCEGPIIGVRRIWAGSKLIYDAADASVEGMLASNHNILGITIYTGDESQTPNSRMQMTLGAGNVSAFRGKAYAVIEDFALADYGNSLLGCPFKFEVMSAATYTQYSQPSYHPIDVFPKNLTYGPTLGRIENGVMKFDHLGVTYSVSANGELVDTRPSSLGTFPVWGHVGLLGDKSVDYLSASYTGWLTVNGVQLMYHYATSATLPADVWHMMGACVDKSGTRLYVLAHHETDHSNWLNIYDEDLNLISQGIQGVYPFVNNAGSFPLIHGTSEVFTVEEGGNYLWYASSYSGVVNVYPIVGGIVGSALHSFNAGTTPFMGPFGTQMTIAAEDGLCWGAHDGGGTFIFSRTAVATPAQVSLASIISKESLSSGYLSSGDIDTTTITQQVTGYKVTTNSAIRSALEALQGPYPFDVIPDGYKVKFVKRGAASVATINYDDLAASADNKSDTPRISVVREMDAQLPRRIEVSYFDATREYDTGEQAAERLNSTGTGVVRIEVPVVMTADEAAQCAETLLYLYHLERTTLSFSLPWADPYNKLQPADPITVVTPEATYFCRITEITQESNRIINITARLADVGIYSPTAKGEVSSVTGIPVSLCGPTILDLLDIPTVSDYNAQPGIIAAARGAYAGWRGASIYRSDDEGTTWLDEARVATPGATVALANGTIGAAPTNAMDVSSVLNVQILSGDFSTVSELALFNGQNHFAYGAAGRWEIIGVKTVALQGDGTYTLSNMLRGRYGSEWAMTTHQNLDQLILLDATELSFAPCPTSIIGASRKWTALGYQDGDADSNSRSFTYAGTNLECRSPCYAKGYKNSSNDFVMEWARRSRTDSSWRDYVDAELGEASESYQVEIYDDWNYATIKRTITGLTAPAATYTAAQQTADFGSVQKYLFAKIYQVSATVGTGYEYRTFIGNPKFLTIQSLIHFNDPIGDPYFNLLALGMHMDDAGLTDITGKTITLNGGAARSSTQSKFGGYSAYFDGTGDYLSVTGPAIGTGDFTVRGWVWVTAATSYFIIFDTRGTDSTTNGFQFYIDAAYKIAFGTGNPYVATVGTTSISNGTWAHVELCRASGTIYGFLNGNLEFTVANTSDFYNTVWKIGHRWDGSGTFSSGYIDDFQVYTGVALHTATFTAPSTAFPNTAPSIIDSAGNAISITGTAQIIDTDGQFGSKCLLASQSSGYMSTPQIQLSDTKWVIDFWVKPVTIAGSTYSGILQFGQAADGTGGFCVVTRYDGLAMCFFTYGQPMWGGLLSTSAWRHCFIQRNGDYLTMGTNGTTGAGGRTITNTPNFVPSVKRSFDIGYANVTYIDPRDVKIDEFQVRIGEAPYPTSDYTTYTIPSSEFDNP